MSRVKTRRARLRPGRVGENPPAVAKKYFGVVAQLGERSVRNAEAEGSNPFGSITEKQGSKSPAFLRKRTRWQAKNIRSMWEKKKEGS